MFNASAHLPTALLITGLLAFSSCKKDDDTPEPTPAPSTPSTPAPSTTPNFGGGDASLWAVRSFSTTDTPIGPFELEVGVGAGAFTNDGYATFQNVGDVTLNSTAMTRASNNAYTSAPSMTNPTGVDFGSGVEWVVGGGSGFAGFTRSITFPFPNVQPLTGATTVVRANGFTLSTTNVASADSVIFLVGNVSKTLPGNATTCTFSAAELSALSAGTNVVQIGAYAYDNEVIGGKNIYFGKQEVRTRTVTIQ